MPMMRRRRYEAICHATSIASKEAAARRSGKIACAPCAAAITPRYRDCSIIQPMIPQHHHSTARTGQHPDATTRSTNNILP